MTIPAAKVIVNSKLNTQQLGHSELSHFDGWNPECKSKMHKAFTQVAQQGGKSLRNGKMTEHSTKTFSGKITLFVIEKEHTTL